MIEDLYNYLRSEDSSPRVTALETNNMPSNVVNSAEVTDQFQQDTDFTEPYIPLTTTQETTDPQIRLEYRQRPGGAVAEKQNAFRSTYNQNQEHINSVFDTQILPDGIEYATLVYSNLKDRLPVISRNGKTVPLQIAEFEKEMKNNPAIWESVVHQASQYENDPNIPYEVKYKIDENNWRSILLQGAVIEMENIMNKELFKAASMNDAFVKGYDFRPFQMMFGDDGKLVSQKVYKKRLDDALNQEMQKWHKENPDPMEVYNKQMEQWRQNKGPLPNLPSQWMRSDMGSWLTYGNIIRGQVVFPELMRDDKGNIQTATYQERTDKDGNLLEFAVPTGNLISHSITNPTYKGSVEEYSNKLNVKRSAIASFRKKFGDYDFMMKNIISTYDGQNPEFIEGKNISAKDFTEATSKGVGTLLRTHQQFMMYPSKGGAVTVPVKYLNFNYRKDYNQGKYNQQTKKWEPEANDNIKEVNNLLWLFDAENVVYTIGSSSDGAKDGIEGNIPKRDQATHDMIKAGVTKILDNIDEANKFLYSKKGERKKYALPEGVVTFVPIAGGNEDYMAFNIKFKTPYFEDSKVKKMLFDKGEKFEDPKTLEESYKDQGPWFNIKDQIINNGITIYLPASVARTKSQLAEFHQSSKVVGGVEGLLSMNKPVTLSVPGAGQITFTKSGDSSVIVSGDVINIAENGTKTDTVPLQNDTLPYTNIISFDKLAMDYLHGYLGARQKQNMLIMDDLKKRYASKDPNELLDFRFKSNILKRPYFPNKGKDQIIRNPHRAPAAD